MIFRWKVKLDINGCFQRWNNGCCQRCIKVISNIISTLSQQWINIDFRLKIMVELKTKNKNINIFSYDSVTLLCNYCDIVFICTSIGCMFSLLKLLGSRWIWTLAYPITSLTHYHCTTKPMSWKLYKHYTFWITLISKFSLNQKHNEY